MDRRTLLLTSTVLALGQVWPSGLSYARQAGKVFRVGVLVNGGATVDGKPNPALEVLRKGMAQLGYVEGSNVIYEARFPDGQLERLPGFAAELLNLPVDVIAAFGGPSTNAARKASTTIPIVAALVADPVAIGVAKTLQRPGGNVTGATNNDPALPGLQFAMLKTLLPKLTRLAVLSDSDIPGADASGLAPIERSNVAAARAAGLTPQVLKIHGPQPDLATAFRTMAEGHAEALVALEVPATIASRKRIAELAVQHRLPTMFWGGAADSGCLLSYGTSFAADFARLPPKIDKILKGAKPGDLPFDVVSQRELAINLKTARALGISVPAGLLKRADHVIE
jgi:putative ABC transport system substrate-binding protein